MLNMENVIDENIEYDSCITILSGCKHNKKNCLLIQISNIKFTQHRNKLNVLKVNYMRSERMRILNKNVA